MYVDEMKRFLKVWEIYWKENWISCSSGNNGPEPTGAQTEELCGSVWTPWENTICAPVNLHLI